MSIKSSSISIGGSGGWVGLIGVIFIVAKVFEISPVADWSWWLVLLPFYLGLAIIFGFLLIAGGAGALYIAVKTAIAMYKERRRVANLKYNKK